MSYIDSLHKSSNYLSLVLPVSVRKVRFDGCGKFAKPLHRKSHLLHLLDISGVSLKLGVKLCDAAFGSSHPSCELILFNQALGEAIDQPLKCLLLFQTLGLESLGILQRSNGLTVSLKLPL